MIIMDENNLKYQTDFVFRGLVLVVKSGTFIDSDIEKKLYKK